MSSLHRQLSICSSGRGVLAGAFTAVLLFSTSRVEAIFDFVELDVKPEEGTATVKVQIPDFGPR